MLYLGYVSGSRCLLTRVFCSGWMRCNQCRNDSTWLNDSRSSMHREATEKVFAESKMKQLGPQGLESAVVWDILVVHVLCVKACNMVWKYHTHTGGKHACEVNRGVSSTCYWCRYQQITTVYSCSIVLVFICTSGLPHVRKLFGSLWKYMAEDIKPRSKILLDLHQEFCWVVRFQRLVWECFLYRLECSTHFSMLCACPTICLRRPCLSAAPLKTSVFRTEPIRSVRKYHR